MSDLDGMNISSESLKLFRDVVSVRDERSVLSLYEAEESLELATTALRKAVQAASKVHAREVVLKSILEAPTTPAQEPVSPFTQRLTHYSRLIQSHAEELHSIAPMSPATAVDDSSKGRESEPLSLRSEPNSSPSNFRTYMGSEEPPYDSIILDGVGDVWQRHYDGWTCAVSAPMYHGWDWTRVLKQFTEIRLIRWGS